MNPFYDLPPEQGELQRRVDRNNADETLWRMLAPVHRTRPCRQHGCPSSRRWSTSTFDAFLGGDGAINPFRTRGDANAMDEIGSHDDLPSSSSARVGKCIYNEFARPGC